MTVFCERPSITRGVSVVSAASEIYPAQNYPEKGILHFDDDEPWVNGDARRLERGAVDLYEVAVHEIGHLLGVDHNQQNREAIMWPSAHPNTDGGEYHLPQLTQDNIDAVQQLYGLEGDRPTSGDGG